MAVSSGKNWTRPGGVLRIRINPGARVNLRKNGFDDDPHEKRPVFVRALFTENARFSVSAGRCVTACGFLKLPIASRFLCLGLRFRRHTES